jgi:putative transposase
MMVMHPGEYQWSSYHANALGESSGLVVPHEEYLRLGIDREQRILAYSQLVEEPLGQQVTDEICAAVNQEVVTGRGEYRQDVATVCGRRTLPAKQGRPKK